MTDSSISSESSEKRTSRIAKLKQKISVRSYFIGWMLAPLIGIVFFPTVLLLFFCMLPSIVAYLVEKNDEKYAAKTVGYINVSATFGLGWQLWTTDNTIQGAIDILNQMLPITLVYLCSLIGWAIYYIIPNIVDTYLQVSYEIRIRAARYRQVQLAKEWGHEIGEGAEELYNIEDPDKLVEEEISKFTAKSKKSNRIKGLFERFSHRFFNVRERVAEIAREETLEIVDQQQKELNQTKTKNKEVKEQDSPEKETQQAN